MIESIDTSLIDWSRAQFAMTAMYHWIFTPLNASSLRSDKRSDFTALCAKVFWG